MTLPDLVYIYLRMYVGTHIHAYILSVSHLDSVRILHMYVDIRTVCTHM